MKKVTYEDWQKNPTPRMMWVWQDDFEEREKGKVVYIIKDDFVNCPVLAVSGEETSFCLWCHCAEIEEPKTRRMTNKELSWWLSEKPHREFKYLNRDYVCSEFDYREYKQDEDVDVDMRIREDGGEWREPLVVYEE